MQSDSLSLEDAFNVAMQMQASGRLEEAENIWKQIVSQVPTHPESQNNYGMVLYDLGRIKEAENAFREAIRLKPELYQAHMNLGNALSAVGDMNAAVDSYRNTIKGNPDIGRAYLALALCKKFQPDDPDIGIIQRRLKTEGMPADDQARVTFALGKAYDDCKEYDKAFPYIREGNRIKSELEPFDRSLWKKVFTDSRDFFTPERFKTLPNWGSSSDLPVFVLGMPRSGTTLIESILSRHPQVHGAGELHDIQRIVSILQNDSGKTYPMLLESLSDHKAKALIKTYEDRLKQNIDTTILRVTDKMPTNFIYLGIIANFFPSARVIHCCRDAMDTCFSNYFQCFEQGGVFANSLEDLSWFYREYEALMAYWHNVLPLEILDVRYEKVVGDVEASARKMVDFIGLEWDDACLEHQSSEHVVKTASVYQVRQPVYKSSIGKWKRYEKHLGLLKEALQVS